MKLRALSITAACLAIAAPTIAQEPVDYTELLTHARASYDMGDWDVAKATYKQIYDGAPDSSVQKAEAALEWANILWEQGDYAAAGKRAQDALERAQKLKLDSAVGRLLLTIGHVEASQGKLGRAQRTLRLCVSMARDAKDDVSQALCRMNLSLVRRVQGKAGIDKKQLEADIAKLQSANTPLAVGSALVKTAELFEKNGDRAKARALLDRAHTQFVRAGNVPAQARNRLRKARLMQEAGDFEGARRELLMAKPALERMKNRPSLVSLHGLMGADARHRGDVATSRVHLKRALGFAEQTRSPQLVARAHLALCESYSTPNVDKRAANHCARAADGFKGLKAPELEARARIAQAAIDQKSGHTAQARKGYTRVVELLESVSPALRNADSIATQRANLCQVDNQLEATGALRSCDAAVAAIRAIDDGPKRNWRALAASHYAAGFAAQREKNIKASLRHFEAASRIYTEQGEHARAADAHLRMGLTYAAVMQGDDLAERSFRNGLAQAKLAPEGALKNTLITQLLFQLAESQLARKKPADALATFERVVAHTKSIGDAANQANAHNSMAAALLELDRRDDAIAALEEGAALIAKDPAQKKQLRMMRDNIDALRGQKK